MSTSNSDIRNMVEESINKPTIKYSAGAVILRRGDGGVQEVLMIQRAKKDHWPLQWEFPRGGCDSNVDDSLKECVKREVKEETGLDIKVIRFLDKIKYVRDGGQKITRCYNYLCKLEYPDQEIRLSSEHEKNGHKWISEVGEVELMASPEQKETIQKVLNDERSIVSYPQRQKTEEGLDFYLENLDNGDIVFEREEEPVTEYGPVVTTMLGVYFGALLLKLAADVYKNNFTKAAKECKGMPGGEKGICMLRAKIRAKEAAAAKLSSSAHKCSKGRNPEKCKGAVQNKLTKLKSEIGYLSRRQKELRGAPIVH